MANRWGKIQTVTDILFFCSKITVNVDCSHEIKRHLLRGRKAMTNINSVLKSTDITLTKKVHLVKAMIFSSSNVWMWELDHKEGWVLKNWCFHTVMLEKTLESPLDSKETKPVNSKGNQPWVFIEMTDAEVPILLPPDAKSWVIGKDLDAGKGWGQEGKEVTQRMSWLDDVTDSVNMSLNKLGNNEGQGSLVCFSPWSHKELTRLRDRTTTTMDMDEEGWGTFLLMYWFSIAAVIMKDQKLTDCFEYQFIISQFNGWEV